MPIEAGAHTRRGTSALRFLACIYRNPACLLAQQIVPPMPPTRSFAPLLHFLDKTLFFFGIVRNMTREQARGIVHATISLRHAKKF